MVGAWDGVDPALGCRADMVGPLTNERDHPGVVDQATLVRARYLGFLALPNSDVRTASWVRSSLDRFGHEGPIGPEQRRAHGKVSPEQAGEVHQREQGEETTERPSEESAIHGRDACLSRQEREQLVLEKRGEASSV